MVKIGWAVCMTIVLSLSLGISQSKLDYTWVLGYDYCETSPGCYADAAEGMLLDFHTSPPTITVHPIPYWMNSINVISHPQTGKLLYYTNGCRIINADHQTMENGEDINKGEFHTYYCNNGTWSYYSDFNGMLSIPSPGNPNQYYLIHRPKNLLDASFTKIWFTTIDMNRNGGKGAVIEKNKPLLENIGFAAGFFTACKHKNNEDWWIIVWEEFVPKCHVFLLDREGISVHHSQTIGNLGPDAIGQAVFSPDGSRYMWYDLVNGVHIYDFDRETGMLSDHKTLSINAYYQYGRGGVSISPNSRFAYLSARDTLYQLDLWAEDPIKGLEVIDTIDHLTEFGIKLNFSNSMLGPDCKIYISTGFAWIYYHIIHFPDKKGKACGLEKLGLTLPFPNSNSAIPNNPHYRMGEAEVCNPRLTSLFPASWYRPQIRIFPNPTSDQITIESTEPISHILMDATGRVLLRSENLEIHKTIDMSHLADGLYLIKCRSKTGKESVHKIIKQ